MIATTEQPIVRIMGLGLIAVALLLVLRQLLHAYGQAIPLGGLRLQRSDAAGTQRIVLIHPMGLQWLPFARLFVRRFSVIDQGTPLFTIITSPQGPRVILHELARYNGQERRGSQRASEHIPLRKVETTLEFERPVMQERASTPETADPPSEVKRPATPLVIKTEPVTYTLTNSRVRESL